MVVVVEAVGAMVVVVEAVGAGAMFLVVETVVVVLLSVACFTCGCKGFDC